ncbi:toll/interleukin-1 receptor domain-containing protein [Agitococcus lubricus]|uniref:TIR domain-containing protein n=1 Tax=Agitococcus lubricus TaxID=1077255 RepID=A0A2T5IT87_9GAMM|nr:toll/interleukin-1 receptor domain-containing protein [Agitococcus lubricus]PTQ87072.1 TIR domain-containing protein [Agitococcus lubricus]
MSSVFLSHSHTDKPFARKLAAGLRAAGHVVWIDEAEINIGDSLVAKIREGLDQVDFVAAILSEASISSEWVSRELDIASNREIDEKRVVVLPLLVQKVALPGFLKGKFYADFTVEEKYEEQLALVVRALGPAQTVPQISASELEKLREELNMAKEAIRLHGNEIEAHRRIALKGKSEKLVEAIRQANARFPQHAPINSTYAFMVGSEETGIVVTLDYLMWAIAKAKRKGATPIDMVLSIENKWDAVEAMISAYSEMIDSANG